MIAYDKKLHFVVGLIVALILMQFVSPLLTLTGVFILAVGKELRDKITGKGTPEWMDIVATEAGGIIGVIICQL